MWMWMCRPTALSLRSKQGNGSWWNVIRSCDGGLFFTLLLWYSQNISVVFFDNTLTKSNVQTFWLLLLLLLWGKIKITFESFQPLLTKYIPGLFSFIFMGFCVFQTIIIICVRLKAAKRYTQWPETHPDIQYLFPFKSWYYLDMIDAVIKGLIKFIQIFPALITWLNILLGATCRPRAIIHPHTRMEVGATKKNPPRANGEKFSINPWKLIRLHLFLPWPSQGRGNTH